MSVRAAAVRAPILCGGGGGESGESALWQRVLRERESA